MHTNPRLERFPREQKKMILLLAYISVSTGFTFKKFTSMNTKSNLDKFYSSFN